MGHIILKARERNNIKVPFFIIPNKAWCLFTFPKLSDFNKYYDYASASYYIAWLVVLISDSDLISTVVSQLQSESDIS